MIAVRRAAPGDVGRIVELWAEMWEMHRKLDERFEPSPMAETVARHWIEGHLEHPRSAVFVAESGGGVEGYLLATIMENLPIVLNSAFGFVSEIAVDARARRSGVGEKLVAAAHAWFREKLITSVEVNVSVRNSVSRAFWKKMGYRDFLERLQATIP